MHINRHIHAARVVATAPIRGRQVRIGTGFSALSFDHTQFNGLMDPLVMVDHFTMSEPTFGPHPHAGMSAVSVLFEDSQGQFHNLDSLGNDLDLGPGDLYWLKAGRGAVHDERPRPGAQTHALQIFVNLPARAKRDAPDALHVPAAQMPELRGPGYRVRVVLGESQGVSGFASPALPLTILDAELEPTGAYVHGLPAGFDAWIHVVGGGVELAVEGAVTVLAEGDAVAVRSEAEAVALELRSEAGAHVVLLQGQPIRERIVQRGPFVMNTREELAAVTAAHAAGELGSID